MLPSTYHLPPVCLLLAVVCLGNKLPFCTEKGSTHSFPRAFYHMFLCKVGIFLWRVFFSLALFGTESLQFTLPTLGIQ